MKFRLATEEDKHLPYYSFSIAEAITTCPKWGLIRYKERKTFRAGARAMALEAGSAMHDVFAAFRLWQLGRIQKLYDHFEYHGFRLFGELRMETCWSPRTDPRDECLAFCFAILNTGEFYDDPDDNIRTMSNMEETIIRYVDEMMAVMDRNPVWVQDVNDPTALVGIELAFDMVIDDKIRYIGTIDGLSDRRHLGENVQLEENKTASRLDVAFRESFRIKFQPTGYTVAARLITGIPDIENSKIIGVKVKQTRGAEDFLQFREHRDDFKITQWYNYIWFVHRLCEEYAGRALEAPMFTHSCNRYFRPCAFIDLCGADYDDQIDMYENMEETPLSPSEESIINGNHRR